MSSVLKFSIILLVAGLVAIGARLWYIGQQSVQTDAVVEDPSVRVVVAAADLPAGLLLRSNDLGFQEMPRSRVPSGALVEGSAEAELQGSLLRHPVVAGERLGTADVMHAGAPGFLAAALNPGMRAVSVSVDDVSGNAGLIQPGDFVDLLLTQRLGEGSGRSIVSETVVENARVIAVGSSFQRQSESERPVQARTITLEASPRTAEAVTVSAQLGSLSVALRSFAIDDPAERPQTGASVVAWAAQSERGAGPVWGSEVSQALGGTVQAAPTQEGPAVASGAPRSITIMRGTQSEERSFGVGE